MIRLNYYAPERILSTAVVRDLWKLQQVRRALAASLTVALFIGSIAAVENIRLRFAQQNLVELRARFAIMAKRRNDAEALVAQVRTLKSLRAQIVDVRRSGADRVAELISIGNRLPPAVYLETIVPSHNSWLLSGHARSIDDLGQAVHALASAGGGSPRLLNLQEETVRNETRVRYSIDLPRAITP